MKKSPGRDAAIGEMGAHGLNRLRVGRSENRDTPRRQYFPNVGIFWASLFPGRKHFWAIAIQEFTFLIIPSQVFVALYLYIYRKNN